MAAFSRRTALAALAIPGLAHAAGYPDRTIRLLVPYGGGGQTDIVSRLTAQALSERLGQTVLPDNRPGGAGNLAAETLVRSPADGYTLLVGTGATNSGINALLYRQLTYNWETDFAHIGWFCTTANVLLVHNSIPAETFPQLLDWIRANPGKFTYASAGVGAITHLIMEDLGARLGLDMVHVPYRQSTQAMTDLLSGRVHARCIGIPEGDTVRTMPTIRALAVTKPERSAQWPGVPTMAETVPGFAGFGYFGLVAPARTPPEIVQRVSAALNDALRDPKLQAGFDRVGADIAPANTPEQFAAMSRADGARWGGLIHRLKLVAE